MQFHSLISFALALVISSRINARKESEMCRELSDYGKKRRDLNGSFRTHDRHMAVFLSSAYEIKEDGFLLGWTFFSETSGSFVLDVLEYESQANRLHVVLKTPVSVTQAGNHTFIMKGEFRVKKGQVLGVHSKAGESVGLAFSILDDPAEGEFSVTRNVTDDALKESGNTVDRQVPSRGRWEAIMAHVLTDTRGTVSKCNVEFELSSRTTFNAVMLEEHSGQTGVSCAIHCMQHHLCLSFVLAADGGCRLYAMIADDGNMVMSDDPQSLKVVHVLPGDILAIASST